MSILNNVRTGKMTRPQRGVIYGVESVGKTTLAASAPAPIFLDLEGGSSHLDVARLEIKTWRELMDALDALVAGGHDYQTVVVDSADWAERLAIANLLEETKQPSIESFPYGKGWVQASERFARFIGKLDGCVSAGMHVLIIAHAQIRRVEPPDQVAAYDRYEPKLAKQTAPILKEWADELYFANFKTKVVLTDGGAKGKARGGKERVLMTTHSAAYDAKTRAGLEEELPLKWESIAGVFMPVAKAKAEKKAAKAEKPAKAPAAEAPAPEAAEEPPMDIVQEVRVILAGKIEREDVEAFLVSRGEIKEGEGWEAAKPTFLQRVAQHPDRFIAAVKGFVASRDAGTEKAA